MPQCIDNLSAKTSVKKNGSITHKWLKFPMPLQIFATLCAPWSDMHAQPTMPKPWIFQPSSAHIIQSIIHRPGHASNMMSTIQTYAKYVSLCFTSSGVIFQLVSASSPWRIRMRSTGDRLVSMDWAREAISMVPFVAITDRRVI